jgi:DNA-binding response OmpR family regulator
MQSLKKKILIVDDTVSLAESMADILRMEGFEVRIAGNGLEGLAAVAEEKPTLVITDIVMPEVDGFEFISKVRSDASFDNIPIIILSAAVKDERIVDINDIGAEMYLRKPCDVDCLIQSVNQLLAEYEQN